MTVSLESMMTQLQLTQLASRQLSLQCGILMDQIQEALKEAEAPPPTPPADQATTEGCRHPEKLRDYSARTMGKPGRFLCRLCGDLVDGDTGTSEPLSSTSTGS